MIRKSHLTLVLLGFVFTISAQQEWTLEECIRYAIDTSLSIEQAEINLAGAGVNQKEAKNSRWPSLSVSAGMGLNFGRVINPSTNSFETDDSKFNNFGLSSGVPIFAGNRINNSIKQAEIELEAFGDDLKQARVSLALDVALNYLNILFAQENLRNAEAKIELSTNQLNQIDKLISAGSRPEAERYDILAQISLDKRDVVTFKNNIVQNLLVIKQLMRLDPNFDLQLADPDIQYDLINKVDSYTFDEVYAKAIETQPQVHAQELRIESSQLDEKIAQGLRYPTLSLGLNAGTNFTDLDQTVTDYESVVTPAPNFLVDGVPDRVSQFQRNPTKFKTTAYGEQLGNNLGYGVSLNLSVPIYSNYQKKAVVDRARLNVLRAENVDEQIKQQLKTDIQNAISSAHAARESFNASQAAVDAAEIAYQNSERRFDLGALNSYDLISAQNRLDSARVNLTISKFDYVFRILVVEYYLGKGLKYE